MFTGLISDLGKVSSLEKDKEIVVVKIQTNYPMEGISIGSSIACNGCCLTLISKKDGLLHFGVSNETLDRTNLKSWKKGTLINLEQSLKVGEELGGHFVAGHIDTVVKISSKKKDGDSLRFTFSIDEDISRYLAEKGSVTLDGVSLTVNEVDKNSFGVNIISHTAKHTNFGNLTIGDYVNLEVDLLCRYIDRLITNR